VEILPDKDGLLHISEIADHRVNRVEDVLNLGDETWVKVLGIDDRAVSNSVAKQPWLKRTRKPRLISLFGSFFRCSKRASRQVSQACARENVCHACHEFLIISTRRMSPAFLTGGRRHAPII